MAGLARICKAHGSIVINGVTNEMSVEEALAKARVYAERDKDVPSVSRTLAAEIDRLRRLVDSLKSEVAALRRTLTVHSVTCITCGSQLATGQAEPTGEPYDKAIPSVCPECGKNFDDERHGICINERNAERTGAEL